MFKHHTMASQTLASLSDLSLVICSCLTGFFFTSNALSSCSPHTFAHVSSSCNLPCIHQPTGSYSLHSNQCKFYFLKTTFLSPQPTCSSCHIFSSSPVLFYFSPIIIHVIVHNLYLLLDQTINSLKAGLQQYYSLVYPPRANSRPGT